MMWNWRDKGLWLEKTLNTSMLSTPTKWKPPSDCWVNESQSYSTAGNLGLCLRSCSDKQPHRAQDQEFLSRADWVRSVPICKGLMNLKNCWPPVENSAAAPESCPWPAACPGASTKPSSSLRHGQQPQEGLLAQAQLDSAMVLVCKTLEQISREYGKFTAVCHGFTSQSSGVSLTKHPSGKVKGFVKISPISFWKSKDSEHLRAAHGSLNIKWVSALME